MSNNYNYFNIVELICYKYIVMLL